MVQRQVVLTEFFIGSKKKMESNISIAGEVMNLIFVLYVKRCFILFEECHCM